MPSNLVDGLDDKTGWAATGTLILDETEDPKYVVPAVDKSLFLSTDDHNTQSAEKTISPAIDLSSYEEILLYVASVYQGKDKYADTPEFLYKIDFGFGEYYIPAQKNWRPHKIQLPGSASLTKIKVTVLHDERDFFVFNYLLAIKDELPLDLLTFIRDGIQAELSEIQIGTVTAAVDDTEINISQGDFIDRYATIRIGGANPETHSIDSWFGKKVTLGDNYDGKKIKYSHTTDPIYLQLPVRLAADTREHETNSIYIWSSEPDMLEISNGESEYLIDTFNVDDTCAVRKLGKNEVMAIQIDCESDHEELLQKLSTAVHRWFKKDIMFANGVRVTVDRISSTRIDAPQIDVIPKQSFVFSVEYEEDVWPRATQKFPLAGVQTVIATPSLPSLPN